MYQNRIKILLDKIGALLAFLLVSPIFIFITLLLLSFQKKVFFRQTRAGKNQKKFAIYKFQTMSEERDLEGKLLPDEARISTFGKLLRATSLDEIPQLLNVLKGDMSIVGPRPLLSEYAHLYSDYQNQRHQVLPGITGYAQVKGRNALPWNERFALDVYYVKHISFVFDCKILLLTFANLLEFTNSAPSEGIPTEPFEDY